MRLPHGAWALSLLCILTFTISAQDLDNVSIQGKIADSNSAPIVGATIVVTLVETGANRTGISGDDGRYIITNLNPGTYKVAVNAAGFGVAEKTAIQTVSGQIVKFDFQLDPAGVKASATVTASGDDAPAVDVTRTVVGGTISQREIEEIPLNSRNPLDLVLTLGGTAEEQLSTSNLAEDRTASVAPLEQGNFSLSGGTAYSNNITIDGLDNNDDRTGRDRFQLSIESVAEVQVISNQFSAEYGRASGGRVNFRTRSGSNQFHGRAFMFFRDDNLNANTWYNNSRGIARTPLTEYDPGFTFGGPIIKKRTFFFVSYEFDKLLDSTLIDAYVPVAANPHYTLPAATGTTQYCDSSTPTACTGASPTAGFIQAYTKTFPTPNISNVFSARVDHQLTRNNNLTFGFQYGNKDFKRTTGAAISRIENALQEKNSDTQAYNVTDNWVLNSKLVNQFRAQWSDFTPSFQTADPLDPVVLIGYRDPISNGLKTLVAGNSTTSTFSSSGGTIFFPENRNEKRWQFQDSLTYVWKNHTFKGGLDIQDVNSKELGLGDATGTFSFASALTYSQNTLSRFRQNFGTGQDVTNRYYGVFFNDEMRPFSNVTLSYGLRYEKETAVSDDNNFGPRFGVAWDPFNKGKGVIRFGAGIFYNRVLLRTVGDSIQNAGGNLVSFDSTAIGTNATDMRRVQILAAIANRFPNSYPTADDLRGLVTTVCSTISSPPGPCNSNTGFVTNVTSGGNPLRSVEPNLKIPESYQFNVGFEREIGMNFVFEVNYTWNKTVHLWRDFNPNAPILPAGYADWTAYLISHPFQLTNQNGTTRTYVFTLGSTTDPLGVSGTTGTNMNVCSFALTNTCTVNLNSTNSSATAPAAAVAAQNNNATGAPIGIALAAISQFRPDQTVEETSRIGSNGNAFYNGLILELRRSYRKLGYGFGTSMRFAYTLSSTRDDGLNNTSNAEVNGDFSREWARNLQDRRHRIAVTGTVETPNWLGKLHFSPLFRYGSSAPFNIGIGGSDRNLDDLGTDRVNFNGDLSNIVWREPGSPLAAALINQFSLQPIGARSGNLPRNAGRGPSFFTFDLGLERQWKIKEHMRLRPVLEFDNIFNAAVFSYGAEFINFTGLTVSNSSAQQLFLVPTRTYRQREIRLGLRFDF
jgi:TonB-dependent Receptor Plug Domain.